jgi:hypothetical protein
MEKVLEMGRASRALRERVAEEGLKLLSDPKLLEVVRI